MATFTDIVRKQRKSGEGMGSSLATAFSERAKERLDPRNYLFNKKGLLTALVPGLKGYQAGGKSAEKLKGGGESGGLGAGAESILNTIADRLTQLKSQFRMVAKNSLVLPQMARDTNITRQNIQKLVKLQGGEASNKADMFFKRSAERESQYENAMKEGKPTSAKEDGKKGDDKEGFFKKIFKFIMPIVTLLVNAVKSVAASIVNAIKGIVEFTKNIPALTNGLGGLVRFLAPGGALLLGLSALGAAIWSIDKLSEMDIERARKDAEDKARKEGKSESEIKRAGDEAVERAKKFQSNALSGAMDDSALGAAIMNETGDPEPTRITNPKQAGFYSPVNQKALARSEVKQFLGKSSADYISSKEGFGGKAYLDPPKNTKNRYALGYGHVIQPHEVAQGYIQLSDNKKITVKGSGGKDTTITKDEAKVLLQSDLPKYEKLAADPLGPEAWGKLNQDQKTALISYAYNTGSTQSLVNAGLKDAIMKGNSAKAAEIISTKGIKTSDGKFSAGLEKRRLSEGALFAGGGDFSYQPNPPKSMLQAPAPAAPPVSPSSDAMGSQVFPLKKEREKVPEKAAPQNESSGVTVNNIDSSTTSVAGGSSGSGGILASVYNDALINLLLDRTISDKMFG
jgi:GH24 family phage-related lysozyme (muramidase)